MDNHYAYTDVHRIKNLPEYHQQVSLVAYYNAQQRGFEPGHDQEDWFNAERYIQRLWLM